MRSKKSSPGWGERNKCRLVFCRPYRGLNIRWPFNPRLHHGLLSAAPPALNVELNSQLDFLAMAVEFKSL
jgi:hypothetical protein